MLKILQGNMAMVSHGVTLFGTLEFWAVTVTLLFMVLAVVVSAYGGNRRMAMNSRVLSLKQQGSYPQRRGD